METTPKKHAAIMTDRAALDATHACKFYFEKANASLSSSTCLIAETINLYWSHLSQTVP